MCIVHSALLHAEIAAEEAANEMPAALQMSPKCTLHEMSRAKSVKLQEIKETRNHQRKSNYFKNNTGSALIFQANGYFWVIPIIVDVFWVLCIHTLPEPHSTQNFYK